MVAVNGVPVVPRIWNDGSLGPFGVLPTLPENPVWLLQATAQTAIAAPIALIDRICMKCRIFPRVITITLSALPLAAAVGPGQRCYRGQGTSRPGSSRWSGT